MKNNSRIRGGCNCAYEYSGVTERLAVCVAELPEDFRGW